MTTFRLSRSLMGILTLIYLSMSACIVGFFTFSASNTSMAQGRVSAVSTACARPSPPANRGNMQVVRGTLKSIVGQKLTITSSQGSSIIATYSRTTQITQRTSVTTAALKTGTYVLIQAIPNANNTIYTAETIDLMQGGSLMQGGQPNDSGCFPGNNPNRLPSPLASPPAIGRQGCIGDTGPGQGSVTVNSTTAVGNSTCIAGTVQQLTGTTLTVKDMLGKSYTITLTKTTTLNQDVPTTSASLTVNKFVTLIGTNTNGAIAAFRITISDKPIGAAG